MILTITNDEHEKPCISFKSRHEPKKRNKGNNLLQFPTAFCVIDVETTGLDPYYCEIIEISAIKYDNISLTNPIIFSELVKPINSIDEYITNLTGITNKMVENCRPINDVILDFASFVGTSIVVGHNVNFDINFIYDNLLSSSASHFQNDFVDTMRLCRWLLPDLENRKLCTLADYYNISVPVSHRSLADCETTAKCYSSMYHTAMEKYGNLESFVESCKTSHRHASSKDITTSVTDFDVTHPIYANAFCFTGTLESMGRKQAMQLVVDLGGICNDTVSKKTNYLVLGNTDFCSNVKGNKTTKTKKAEQYKLDGQDIQIISENVFLDMVSI